MERLAQAALHLAHGGKLSSHMATDKIVSRLSSLELELASNELGVTGFGFGFGFGFDYTGFDWTGKIFEIGFGRTVVD